MKFAYEKPFDFPIVALAGYARSGKSTASEALINFGYKVFSFAEPIKKTLSDVYNVPIEWFYDPILKETPHGFLNGKTPRRAMQLLGTEGFRNLIDEATFTKCLEHKIFNHMNGGTPNRSGIVVDDLRFISELEMLVHHRSTILYIDNPKVGLAHSHQSETEMLSIMEKSFIILNNGSIEQLHKKVLAACLNDSKEPK